MHHFGVVAEATTPYEDRANDVEHAKSEEDSLIHVVEDQLTVELSCGPATPMATPRIVRPGEGVGRAAGGPSGAAIGWAAER